ncbi:MAG: hypothetical protein WC889_16095, partial [Myxococcota bacterium]
MKCRIVCCLAAVIAVLVFLGCGEAVQPPYAQVVVLKGTPYQRGYQHGKLFSNRIKSLYTGLLTSSLLPYLNREQPDIGEVLTEYCTNPDKTVCPTYDKYSNGKFSYQLMLQSGRSLEKSIPAEYIEEMKGISDGSGVPYDTILVLNTFLDTMLNFRSLTFYIRKLAAPYIDTIEFQGGLESDGVDNNGNGVTDEPGEGAMKYEAGQYATIVEVPVDAKFKMTLRDLSLKPPAEGVNPRSVRIQMNEKQFVWDDGSMTFEASGEGKENRLDVTFAPPGGFPAVSTVSLIIQAGDNSSIDDPPPEHARYMRDERITFTTKGFGMQAWEVPNKGYPDGRTQPPSQSISLRGTATKDGSVIAAQNFGLLDSNVSHKHTVLFVHIPDSGTPFAVVGWSGLTWGFSGMNLEGLVYMVNSSDTLNNPMVKQLADQWFNARLLATGVPVGISGREMLSKYSDVAAATEYLKTSKKTFGWNILLT